jgi:cytochrome c-type biogenesis protein CcmH/NrfG
LNKDCKIIIKLGDPKTISTYRGKQPSEIRKIFNHQCQKAARDGAKALLAIQAVTAQQLKSGDIAIRLRSAAETETARKLKDQWLPRFGRGAYVQTMTYGVLIHGVPYSSLESLGGVGLEDQKAIINMLQAHNDY